MAVAKPKREPRQPKRNTQSRRGAISRGQLDAAETEARRLIAEAEARDKDRERARQLEIHRRVVGAAMDSIIALRGEPKEEPQLPSEQEHWDLIVGLMCERTRTEHEFHVIRRQAEKQRAELVRAHKSEDITAVTDRVLISRGANGSQIAAVDERAGTTSKNLDESTRRNANHKRKKMRAAAERLLAAKLELVARSKDRPGPFKGLLVRSHADEIARLTAVIDLLSPSENGVG